MHFTRLRLTGFKSFVDATDLPIEPGLTGIVGPNGCGKSNLVEALRWVMGEASVKRMRGTEMDDVIFGGTAQRPARNLADVTLVLDNADRSAPAPFAGSELLEVCRRIERGCGSDYRINGRSVRARDVQLLFQDRASGANSAAMVGQGRVGALIAARPVERRQLLEEAAGIAGLHSRRAEAEQRLRAAEDNLLRLDDVVAAMETQLGALRKQARQATRYRNLSQRIRQTEALVLHLRWQAAAARLAAAEAGLAAAEAMVRERTAAAARAGGEQAEAAADLPALRQAEQAAAEGLRRAVAARQALDAEEARLTAARQEAERQLDQVADDLGRERSLAREAAEALARLAEEERRLEAAIAGEPADEQAARQALAEAQRRVDERQSQHDALTAELAAAEAQRQAVARRRDDLTKRLANLDRRQGELARQQAGLDEEIARSPDPAGAEAALAEAQQRLETARAAAEAAEAERQQAEAAETGAREARRRAEADLARTEAEAAGLSAVLASARTAGGDPILDHIAVESGYEAALGAALGEDLSAPVDEAAPVHWRTLPPLAEMPPLPAGAEPLAPRVRAPAALARRLAAIGVVADAAAATALVSALRPGQRLVSRDGTLWRWDGFTADGRASGSAGVRLQQRNRLAELEMEAAERRGVALAAGEAHEAARAVLAAARGAEQSARQAVQTAFAALDQARRRQAELAQAAAARRTRQSNLAESLRQVEADRAEAEAELRAADEATTRLPDFAAKLAELTRLREALAERRQALAGGQARLQALQRDQAGRRHRRTRLAAERQDWSGRAERAARRMAELEERAAVARQTLAALADRPAALAAERAGLLDRIGEAERARQAAADALAAGESRQQAADRAARAAEAALAAAREDRLRAEAAVEAAGAAAEGLRERIAERLQSGPEALAEIAGLKPEEAPPEAAEIEAKLERLLRERDGMGPVNLRAEIEATELEQEIGRMTADRADVTSAIARLRQGIASLDREARERLMESFAAVDQHFQSLFTRLFGGGRAQLKLVESDDPLSAGLDILASPPGKRLQSLSLLSGGEQALTAIALLFAVFLTNPAPICVLDEVDAPLDDANVDRFCTLLEELTRRTATRFLVVTHHRMTMARADRLFGVTMPERGVSQLVSVDLQRAVALRRTA